jgi:hypothetical protein
MTKEKRDHSFGSLAERPKPSDFVAHLDRAGWAVPTTPSMLFNNHSSTSNSYLQPSRSTTRTSNYSVSIAPSIARKPA